MRGRCHPSGDHSRRAAEARRYVFTHENPRVPGPSGPFRRKRPVRALVSLQAMAEQIEGMGLGGGEQARLGPERFESTIAPQKVDRVEHRLTSIGGAGDRADRSIG